MHVDLPERKAEVAWADVELDSEEASRYRAAAARLNYMALDRPDVMYSAKECSRIMSRPTNKDWELVTRLVRYMMQAPRLVQTYQFQDEVWHVDS